MEKFNVNVILCEEYDERTQSFIGIINRIELDKQMRENPIQINIITFLSGYGEELKPDFALDYYMKCVKDNSAEGDKDFSDKISYLFSMSMHEEVESCDEKQKKCMPASYPNTFQNIGRLEKKVLLPCEGRFEVQVFLNDTSEKKPLERYKTYVEKEKEPLSIYYFDVVDRNEENE